MQEKIGKIKHMYNDLFIYLSDLIFSVPTPPTSSLVAPLSTHMMARKARICVFKKVCDMKQWKYRLWMLSKSLQVAALRSNNYRLNEERTDTCHIHVYCNVYK